MRLKSMTPEPHSQMELPPPPPRRPTAIDYEDYAFPPGLTPRETDILRLAISGLDNQQIAQRLGTTMRNVEKYIPRLQWKIDTHSKDSPLNHILKNRN